MIENIRFCVNQDAKEMDDYWQLPLFRLTPAPGSSNAIAVRMRGMITKRRRAAQLKQTRPSSFTGEGKYCNVPKDSEQLNKPHMLSTAERRAVHKNIEMNFRPDESIRIKGEDLG
jgi:hypothetical protein